MVEGAGGGCDNGEDAGGGGGDNDEDAGGGCDTGGDAGGGYLGEDAGGREFANRFFEQIALFL